MSTPLSDNRRERGAVVVLVAVWLPVLALFAAFAIDVAHWFDYSRNLQNRADAAALAAGNSYGGLCTGTPTGPELDSLGRVAQKYSGPPDFTPDSNLPYAFATALPYYNQPNLRQGTPDNFHLLLNSSAYWDHGGTNFSMGNFCSATDDGQTGPMVDVRVTQAHMQMFIPLLNFTPNISAHARVSIQGIGDERIVRPVAVADASSTPCVTVNLVKDDGSGTVVKSVQLPFDQAATTANGPSVYDNGVAGTAVTVPSSANLYAQVQDSCSGTGTSYESSSGLLLLNTYDSAGPANGQPPRIVGSAATGDGVTLATNGQCAPDQYFSTNTASGCGVTVQAVVAFTPDADPSSKTVTATLGNRSVPLVNSSGNIWSWPPNVAPFTVAPQSGQNQIQLSWTEKSPTQCKGNASCSDNFGTGAKPSGIEQQAFASCNEAVNAACSDPNQSGPIILARIGVLGNTTVGSLKAGTRTLLMTVELKGLQNAQPGDPATVLRYSTASSPNSKQTGLIDCGQGNGTGQDQGAILNGCPAVGTAVCPTNYPQDQYCAPFKKTPDGSCNNTIRASASTATASIDCVATSLGTRAVTIPACIAALILTGGSAPPGNSCNVSGSTGCTTDQWLIDPSKIKSSDPRAITMIITSPADLSKGAQVVPIRTFATFYITGWFSKQGNGGIDPCPSSGVQRNETFPGPGTSQQGMVWGHWMSETDPNASGNGQPCDFAAFGNCAAVLNR
jgi:hypothetical protein